jgi:hypothetical protein
MNTHREVDVYIHVFLTSAVFGGEYLASRSGHITPGYPLNRRLY